MILRAGLSAAALAALALGALPTRADTDLRERVEREHGIRLVETEARFGDEEVRIIYEELRFGALSSFGKLPSLELIEKRTHRGILFVNYGGYNSTHRRIRITDGAPDFKRVFIHEYFHAVGAGNAPLFESFCLQAGWIIGNRDGQNLYDFVGKDPETGKTVHLELTDFDIADNSEAFTRKLELPIFPSEYSKLGPVEMFAETATATVFAIEQDSNHPYRLEKFQSTPLYGWWLDRIDSGGL